jgi:hypothetical protein
MASTYEEQGDLYQTAARRARATGAAVNPLAKASREKILAECKNAASAWADAPGRNLVLMFDGTGNILGNQEDTNVVRLMRVIDKHCGPEGGMPAQLVYYDPGVGSSNEYPSSSLVGLIRQKLSKIGGLALGSGAFEDAAPGVQVSCRAISGWRQDLPVRLFARGTYGKSTGGDA